jgi:hypothetical protein
VDFLLGNPWGQRTPSSLEALSIRYSSSVFNSVENMNLCMANLYIGTDYIYD